MNVEIVHHKMPTPHARLRLDSAFDVVEKVLFISCATIGRRDDLSSGDIQVDDERLRAVSGVLEFLALHLSRSHGQGRMLSLHGLHTAQLICAQHPFTFLCQLRRLPIGPVDVINFLVKLLVMNRRQPIAGLMRLEIALFLKASPRVWARCDLQCLVS
jgi:hypothetical protein